MLARAAAAAVQPLPCTTALFVRRVLSSSAAARAPVDDGLNSPCSVLSGDDPLLPYVGTSKATPVHKVGVDILNDPWYTKGTGFNASERDRLGLRGLLPPRIIPFETQVDRIMGEYNVGFSEKRAREPSEEIVKSGVTPEMIRKFNVLQNLQDRNETLFYRILMDNFKEMCPIIYTPTVGWACQNYAATFRRSRGMYFSAADRGEMASMTHNWPTNQVDAIVVTDGSRILGLGDLGVSGMGISVGKLDCYVAAAGFHPSRVLPVCIDVGTNNEEFLEDPMYLGLQHNRIEGPEYYEIMDEFMAAVTTRWPGVLIQFEDFSYQNAKTLLERYRRHHLTFNDDIQGTAATALSGVYGALRAQGRPISDVTKLKFVVAGAGSAGMGVVNQLQQSMVKFGLGEEEACRNFWVCDHLGLITKGREGLPEHVKPFARPESELEGVPLVEAAKAAKPSALLGLSGQGQLFKADLLSLVGESAAAQGMRPLVFPLSNPTSCAESTPQQIQEATGGKAIVATGSPFPDVEWEGATIKSNQGNNVYIFPGIALGVVAAKTGIVTDNMLMAASEALVGTVPEEALARGQVFPDLINAREISLSVAVGVIQAAADEGLARGAALKALEQGHGVLREHLERSMFTPEYTALVPQWESVL